MTDSLKDQSPDFIIYGGGDILNSYFYPPFVEFLKSIQYKGKICAFSVGIQFPSYLEEGNYSVFDYIYVRSVNDTKDVRKSMEKSLSFSVEVKYCPDLVLSLCCEAKRSKKERSGGKGSEKKEVRKKEVEKKEVEEKEARKNRRKKNRRKKNRRKKNQSI